MRLIGLAVVLTLSLALTPLAGVTIMIAEKAVDMIRAGATTLTLTARDGMRFWLEQAEAALKGLG